MFTGAHRLSVGKTLLLIPLLVLAAMFAGPLGIQQVHAATGLVCLADPSTANLSSPCPASPPVFDGPPGQQIRIGVFVSGSDGLAGFDITLLTNHTFLRPAGIDLTGTVLLGNPVILAECLSGVQQIGSCSVSTDTVDTIHLAAVSALGQPLTGTPTNGLFFTAIYNITSTTSPTGESVNFQTGCGSLSSPTSDPPICVTVAGGTPTPNPETVQGASFTNSDSSTMPVVVLSASPTSFGPEFPSTSNSATVTATAMNGYPGLLGGDQISFTTKSSAGLVMTLSGSNPCSTGGTFCSISLTLSAASAGNYSGTVFGKYATNDSLGNPDTLVSTVSFFVDVYDFAFSVKPPSLSFNSATTGTSTVVLTSLNGFSGSVTLSTGTSLPLGLTITYNPNPVVLTAGANLTSTATFSANPSSSTTYHATIRATSGSKVKTSPTLTILVSVGPDFGISANPTKVSTNVGVAGSSTITITSFHSFTSDVVLTNQTSSSSLSCNLSPGTVTGGSGTSTLTCTGSLEGVFPVNVTGTSGSLTHAVTVTFNFTVPRPNFSVSANPGTVAVLAGATATSNITVSSLNNFAGSVGLGSVVGGGSGLTCSFGRSSLNIPANGSNSTLLSCSGSEGAYTVTVTASNATVSHSTTVAVNVQDFSMTAAPPSLSINATISGTSIITVSPQQGFSSTVNLSSSVNPGTGLTCSLSPTSVVLSGTAATSTLSCSGSTGSYTVTVTGTNGTLTHQTTVTFTVEDFALSASPSTVQFAPGNSGTSTITVSSLNGFSATVTLTALPSGSSLTASFSPTSVSGGSGTSTLTLSDLTAGSFTVDVTGTSGALTHTITITVNVAVGPDYSITANPATIDTTPGVTGDSTINLKALAGFTGTINLSESVAGGAGLSCTLSPTSVVLGTSQNSTLSCSGSGGVYTVTVTGTNGTLSGTHSVAVTVQVQDFTVSPASSNVSVALGNSGTDVVTISPLNGFSATVALSVVSNSTNLVCSLSPSSVVGGSGTSTLSCAGSVVGNYSANVTGTSGPLSHSTIITFAIQDFGITASPTSLTVNAHASGTSTISITPVNGFSGTVSLSFVTNSTSLSCSLSSLSISGGSGSSTLSCSGSVAGNFLATVTGTVGSLSHSVDVTFAVQDFTISASKSTVNVNVQSSDSSVTITVTGLNQFGSTVNLSANETSGLTTSLSPTSVTGSGSSTLTLNGVTVGNYTVIVTGTSGGLSHTVSVTVHVGDFVLTGNPAQETILEGFSGVFHVTLASDNGFTGTVSLSYIAFNSSRIPGPNVPTVVFGSSTVTLSAGGSQTVSVTVNVGKNVRPDIYGVNVTASFGSSRQTLIFSVTVPAPNYRIVASPDPVVFAPGGSGSSTINVTSLGGIFGQVSLSLSYSKPGLACSLGLSSLNLVATKSNTTSLVCTGPTGAYNVTITGQGLTPYNSTVTSAPPGLAGFVAADFRITSTPAGILVNTTQPGHALITITWSNSFDGTVTLSLVSPTGLNATLNSATVHGSTGTANITVVSNVAGTYTLVVNAVSGSDSHSVSITVTVQAAGETANFFSSPEFYALLVVLILVVAGGLFYLYRRSRAKRAGLQSKKR